MKIKSNLISEKGSIIVFFLLRFIQSIAQILKVYHNLEKKYTYTNF